MTDINEAASPVDSRQRSRIPEGLGSALLMGLLFVVSLLVRSVNWHQVFNNGRVYFLEGDAFYHMRRVFLALQNGFSMPDVDPFMNFPQGLHCNWPPLFDQIIAATAWLVGAGHPGRHLVESVGAVMPALMGAASVAAVCYVARLLAGRPYDLVAGLVLCFLPYHIQVSVIGRPDHHVAVVLFSCLLMLVKVMEASTSDTRWRLLMAALGGICLYLLLSTWTGSVVFVFILLAHGCLCVLAHRNDAARCRHELLGNVAMFVCAAVLLWPVAAGTYWSKAGILQWDGLGMFHIVLLVGCAASVAVTWLVSMAFTKSSKHGMAALAGLLFLAGISAWPVASFLRAFAGSSAWLLKTDPIMKFVYESEPLSAATAGQNFTWLVFLFPVIAAAAAFALWRGQRKGAAALLLCWAGGTGACAVVQERFSDIFSAPAAILIAFAARFIVAGITDTGVARAWKHVQATSVAAATLILLMAALPTFRWLWTYQANARAYSPAPLYEVLDWIRENTPRQDGFCSPTNQPAYSVMATWELGNMLTYVAERANVANGFVGWKENAEINLAPYRILMMDNPDDASRALRRRGARYLIIGEPLVSGQLATIVGVLGLKHDDFFSSESNGNKVVHAPRERTMRTMAMRLFLSNDEKTGPFRLLHESRLLRISVAGKDRGTYRIYEVLKE